MAGGASVSVRHIFAERVGETIELNATYADKELTASIPGSRFHSPPPVWTVPLTWAACRQLRGTFRDRLEVGPRLNEWAGLELERRVNDALQLRDEIDGGPLPIQPPKGHKLRPYQESDVRWMLAAKSGLLMNPVGSGKTPSVLTWMRNQAMDRVLIGCPAIMRFPWAEMAREWYPELEPIVVIGTAVERRRLIEEVNDYGGLAIVGHEALRLHSRLAPYGAISLTQAEKTEKDLNLIEWDAFVFDEAHRLADPKSKMTRAAWAIQAGQRWGLSATPVTKGLDTLWSLLHFADPTEWPARSKFIDRYCMTSKNFWGGLTVGALRPEMEAEFRSIFEPRSRRLPKEIALPGLPEIIPIIRELDMTKEQQQAYDQMAKLSLAQVNGTDVVVATSTAAKYTRLGQFATSCAHVETRPARNPETGKIEDKDFVELNLPSNKINAFLSDLEDWLAQEESVIAFATSKRFVLLLSDVLSKKKIRHSMIVGGQSDIDRHEQVKAFQDGDVPVMLMVVKAGGSGITLTKARVGAFLQRSWAHWEDEQAFGRYHRIGSEVYQSVIRVDYLSKGTPDIGQFYDVLPGKEGMLQQVLRDKETIARMLRGERAAGGHARPTAEEAT